MKRDPILLSRMLKAIEAAPYDFSEVPIDLQLEGYSEDTVGYHVLLLLEAGMITASTHGISDDGRIRPRPIRLTWKGHEYLDRTAKGMSDET